VDGQLTAGGLSVAKDPSKVDRSGAYMARYIAKNLVATGLMSEVEVQLSYAIGVAAPTSIYINTFESCDIPEDKLEQVVRQAFPSNSRWNHRSFKAQAPNLPPNCQLWSFWT
jgi:S-adenosylmethionine synthetase